MAVSRRSSTPTHEASTQEPVVPPVKISRPSNAWILYRSEKLLELKSLQDSVQKRPRQADLSRIIADRWHNESRDVRLYYEGLAAIKKADHLAQNPEYKFQPRQRAPSLHGAGTIPSPSKRRKKSSNGAIETDQDDADYQASSSRLRCRTKRRTSLSKEESQPPPSLHVDPIDGPVAAEWAAGADAVTETVYRSEVGNSETRPNNALLAKGNDLRLDQGDAFPDTSSSQQTPTPPIAEECISPGMPPIIWQPFYQTDRPAIPPYLAALNPFPPPVEQSAWRSEQLGLSLGSYSI